MKYNLTVIIQDPNTKEGMNSELVYILDVIYSHNPNTYGNGYYVYITDNEGFENCYDLRYSMDFDSDKKEAWIVDWAYKYWSGKNGAYEVKSLTISKDND